MININLLFCNDTDRDVAILLLLNAIDKEIEYIERGQDYNQDSIDILTDIRDILENNYEG